MINDFDYFIMENIITSDIIKKFQPLENQIIFEGREKYQEFLRILINLYKIPIYKDGLDLIIGKTFAKKVKFEIKIIKDWDTNIGCYLTEQKKIYNKFLNRFTHILDHKIIIRKLSANVMAHEIGHFLEIESGISLDSGFKDAVITDLTNDSTANIALKAEIKRLFINDVKSYPNHQITSEFFARFFEIYSIAKGLSLRNAFTMAEIDNYFINANNWVKNSFLPKIKPLISNDIAILSNDLMQKNIHQDTPKFSDNIDRFHKRVNDQGGSSWSKNVKSNADWSNKFNN